MRMHVWIVFLLLLTGVSCMSAGEKKAEKARRDEARLTAQVADLEQRIEEEREEGKATLDRLRTNREKKLGALRRGLWTLEDDFSARLDEVRIAKKGE